MGQNYQDSRASPISLLGAGFDKKLGFLETGEILDGEIVAALKL
jgi:hypothetical protein